MAGFFKLLRKTAYLLFLLVLVEDLYYRKKENVSKELCHGSAGLNASFTLMKIDINCPTRRKSRDATKHEVVPSNVRWNQAINLTRELIIVNAILWCNDISSEASYGTDIPLIGIHPNPGPVRNPCSICSNPVARTHRAVNCEECKRPCHIKCAHISPKAFNELQTVNTANWVCSPCKQWPTAQILASLPFSELDDITEIYSSQEYPTWTEVPEDQNNAANFKEPNTVEWYVENIRSYYKFNLIIAHLNVNAIVNKVDDIKSLLNKCSFDILFLAETKLNSSINNSLLEHPDYRIIRRDRTRHGGGIMAYVRSNVTAVRRRNFEPLNVESLCLDVKGKNGAYLMVCACYRSPDKCKPAVFLNSLTDSLEQMYNKRKELLLLGDFNFDMLAESAQVGKFREVCEQFQLTNTIRVPTRVTLTTATLLDLIISSHPDCYNESGTLHLGISDHDLVFTVRKQKLPKPPPKFISYRSMKTFNEVAFISDLGNVPWDTAYIFESVDDIWSHWVSLYKEVLDMHAPKKTIRVRGDQLPWISVEIKREISRRNRLHVKFRKNRTDENWNVFKAQRNKVTSLKRKALRSYFVNEKSSSSRPRDFWKKLKPLLPTTREKNSSKITLMENSVVQNRPAEVAEIFNDYFVQSGLNHSTNLEESDFDNHVSISMINQKINSQGQVFDFQTVSTSYILDILKNVNSSKATGADDIPPRLLKLSAPALAAPLARLINHCIQQSTWISEWKSSNITPSFKKDDEAVKENYRPISILPCLSKVFERVMQNQLYEYFAQFLSDSLSGFLKGHSCCTALVKITEDWRKSLDDKETVSAVSLDLSKAFDTICHRLLLRKLKAYGVSPTSLQLIRSYLIGRKQRVKVEQFYSQWKTVHCGVPQGSLLGPLFFNIYINDITQAIKNVLLRLYADDITEYTASNSPAVLQFYINSDLAKISQWLESNYLMVNATKTQAMIIGSTNYNYEISLNSVNIQIKDDLTLLGILIDNKLSFAKYIKYLLHKVYARNAALRKIRNFIDKKTAIRLYKAYFLPYFDYCAPLLVGISNTLSEKLENANYYILRTLLKLPKSVSYDKILSDLNLKTLRHRRYVQSLTLVFKSYKIGGARYIAEMFDVKKTKYNLRGSGSRFSQPAPNTKYFHRSFSYIICRLWNTLSDDIRNSSDANVFINKLNKLTLMSEPSCNCIICK